MLIRNFAGLQGLSVKAGRQYVVFGNQSLFGAFDWSNTGFSHDGVMLQYSTKAWDTYAGWFRNSESDLGQAVPVGAQAQTLARAPSITAARTLIPTYSFSTTRSSRCQDSSSNPTTSSTPTDTTRRTTGVMGLGTPRHSNQTRHNVGNRIEMRKGNFDAMNETVYQFGQMGDNGGPNGAGYGNQKYLHISAWATRNWIGYTHYEWAWKPRLAFNFDYASGDGRANCTIGGNTGCKTANTFENMYPTNHIHMGYMDVQAWKNMMDASRLTFNSVQPRMTTLKFGAAAVNLANTKDNWYRATQGVYVYSKTDNTKTHIGDEMDFAWTHLFMDGKLSFQAVYGHIFAGDYIKENLGTNTDQDWAYAQLWINF